MLRMLLIGYLFVIRSERRLCEKCISASLIVGSVGSIWRTGCPTIPPSLRNGTAPRLQPASPAVRAGGGTVRSYRTGLGARRGSGRQYDHGRRQSREETEGRRQRTSDPDDDLADLLVAFEEAVCLHRFGERKNARDRRTECAV